MQGKNVVQRTVGGVVLGRHKVFCLFERGKFKKEWIQWKSCGSGMTTEIGFENHFRVRDVQSIVLLYTLGLLYTHPRQEASTASLQSRQLAGDCWPPQGGASSILNGFSVSNYLVTSCCPADSCSLQAAGPAISAQK